MDKAVLQSATAKEYNVKLSCGEYKSNKMLLDFPTEIIENIICWMSYEEIGYARAVCTKFKSICSRILNKTFAALQKEVKKMHEELKACVDIDEPPNDSREFDYDVVDSVELQLFLMKSMCVDVFGTKRYDFFAGKILDEVRRLLDHIKSNAPWIEDHPLDVTERLSELGFRAIEHFSIIIEPQLPQIQYRVKHLGDRHPSSCVRVSVSAGRKRSTIYQPDSVIRMRKVSLERNRYKCEMRALRRELICCKDKLAAYDRAMGQMSDTYNSLLREMEGIRSSHEFYRSMLQRDLPNHENPVDILVDDEDNREPDDIQLEIMPDEVDGSDMEINLNEAGHDFDSMELAEEVNIPNNEFVASSSNHTVQGGFESISDGINTASVKLQKSEGI